MVQRGWKPEERRGDRGEVDGGADSEVAFYREGGRRPLRRAQRSQGHVSLPRGRMGIDSAGQKGRLCKDTIWLIIWDIHIYLSKCIIYTHIYSHTAHLVSILVPCQGLNRCRPLAVKAGSQPLDHWGIPCMLLFILFISPRDVS